MNRLFAIALTTLVVVGYSSSAQAEERPFQGALSGSLFGISNLNYEVRGQATHLGHSSASLGLRTSPGSFFRIALDLLRDFPLARSSQTVFVAADGSALQGTIRYDSFDEESLTAVAEITITSGTRRFAEAGGTIDVLLLFTSETLLECDVLMDGTLDY